MAVRIPIVTVFDSKGLKQAQHALNKVRGNFQNLGRNFAIAGAAFAGAAAVIAKSAQDLARIERINAQTEAVLKSMGSSAGVTAKHIEDLAGNLEKLTATEAETIQEGANLLLTFRNIQNQVGANNDIFDQAVKMSVDLSRAMGTTASGEAIRLGKALNDPVKGVSALTRVGVSFTEQQKDQIKTLSESGDMLGAQKIILSELQAQFGGSGQAYAATFAGQVELLNHELGALGEEATMVVMPALKTMIEELRILAPEIGTKLSAAIASVDWAAFTKAIVDTITFLVEHAETIGKVVTALFILNTTYNVVKVATGLFNAAAFILGNTFVVTAGKIGLATGAVKLFRTALITTGIGALVVGLGFVIAAIMDTNSAAEEGKPAVDNYGGAIRKSGADAEWAAGKYGVATAAARDYNNAVGEIPAFDFSSVGRSAATSRPLRGRQGSTLDEITSEDGNKGSGIKKTVSGMKLLTKNLKIEAKKQAAFGRLTEKKGLSGGLAQAILGGPQPLKTAAKIVQGTKKAAKQLQKLFNKTQAGKDEKAAIEQAASAADDASAAAAAAAAAARKAALEEEKRLYKSFGDSVASTFAGIKDRILDAFSLPDLGNSTASIIRNMNKLLGKAKSFSSNITQLSKMGLDPALLQQIINAGPMAGAALAANLVAGGLSGIAQINTGFAELGGIASDIAMTGTQSLFGTQAQQNIYNINIKGGLDSAPSIGKAIVDAIKAYERTSGAIWQVA